MFNRGISMALQATAGEGSTKIGEFLRHRKTGKVIWCPKVPSRTSSGLVESVLDTFRSVTKLYNMWFFWLCMRIITTFGSEIQKPVLPVTRKRPETEPIGWDLCTTQAPCGKCGDGWARPGVPSASGTLPKKTWKIQEHLPCPYVNVHVYIIYIIHTYAHTCGYKYYNNIHVYIESIYIYIYTHRMVYTNFVFIP